MTKTLGIASLLLIAGLFVGCSGQAPACAVYEACLAGSCPGCEPFADSSLIGQLGDCWNGTPAEAENCETGCIDALAAACAEFDTDQCCEEPEHIYVG